MEKKYNKRDLTKKSENISKWYLDVVQKAELAEYGPAKGTMIIRPYAYAIWEQVQNIFNRMIRKYGVSNAYFPLFIPYSLIEKEKAHAKGFSPELAIVTHGGGEKLTEPLVVRPTSETIIHTMFAKWIKSWRDLPLKINQWGNVVRWEKRTYPFLRTTEFLWQEGHTAHEDEKDAMKMVNKALEWYKEIYEEYFAVPVLVGKKSASETFAGAKETYAVEALMPDGKALQGATSHNLGQSFAKAFEISYQNKEGKSKYPWLASWGISTRSLGGLFLVHGDNNGLVLPPKIAPIQVVIIPIYKSGTKKRVLDYSKKIYKDLALSKVRVKLDDRSIVTPGYKFNEWELKGVPIRIEVGIKEVLEEEATLKSRIQFYPVSQTISAAALEKTLKEKLRLIQRELYKRAYQKLGENTHEVDNYSEFKEIMRNKNARGLLYAFWCGSGECEAKIKEETKATARVLPLGAGKKQGKCIYCGKAAEYRWYFAQAH